MSFSLATKLEKPCGKRTPLAPTAVTLALIPPAGYDFTQRHTQWQRQRSVYNMRPSSVTSWVWKTRSTKAGKEQPSGPLAAAPGKPFSMRPDTLFRFYSCPSYRHSPTSLSDSRFLFLFYFKVCYALAASLYTVLCFLMRSFSTFHSGCTTREEGAVMFSFAFYV